MERLEDRALACSVMIASDVALGILMELERKFNALDLTKRILGGKEQDVKIVFRVGTISEFSRSMDLPISD